MNITMEVKQGDILEQQKECVDKARIRKRLLKWDLND